jgi:hypothetical protein
LGQIVFVVVVVEDSPGHVRVLSFIPGQYLSFLPAWRTKMFLVIVKCPLGSEVIPNRKPLGYK